MEATARGIVDVIDVTLASVALTPGCCNAFVTYSTMNASDRTDGRCPNGC